MYKVQFQVWEVLNLFAESRRFFCSLNLKRQIPNKKIIENEQNSIWTPE